MSSGCSGCGHKYGVYYRSPIGGRDVLRTVHMDTRIHRGNLHFLLLDTVMRHDGGSGEGKFRFTGAWSHGEDYSATMYTLPPPPPRTSGHASATQSTQRIGSCCWCGATIESQRRFHCAGDLHSLTDIVPIFPIQEGGGGGGGKYETTRAFCFQIDVTRGQPTPSRSWILL